MGDPAAIQFVLQGLQIARSGLARREPGGQHTLAREFADNGIGLYLNARTELSYEKMDEPRSWISGADPTLTTPRGVEPVTGSAINDPLSRPLAAV
jgi:hypothetical protein